MTFFIPVALSMSRHSYFASKWLAKKDEAVGSNRSVGLSTTLGCMKAAEVPVVIECRVGSVFVDIHLELGSPIDILDLFRRSWNAELERNAAEEPVCCLLRLPVLRVGTVVYSGVVALVQASGVIRTVCTGSIEAGVSIANYVFAYVRQRLTQSVNGTTSIVFFQVFMHPKFKQRRKSAKPCVSESAAEWLRARIASLSSSDGANTDDKNSLSRDSESGHCPNHSLYCHWWGRVVSSRVSFLSSSRKLLVSCQFGPPLSMRRFAAGEPVKEEREISHGQQEASAFFAESEMVSVVPMGSVFVAVPDDVERDNCPSLSPRKRRRCGEDGEVCAEETVEPCNTAGAVLETDGLLCPMVTKSRLSVELVVFASGKARATADTMDGLSFVVEEVLIPLLAHEIRG
uniref:Uncharacterized protein n=1 Tax=Trypanosoma vivax (strain Y486) TaxID=1055687 RepID=G0TZ29_TRYVY|nr:conserved hypothetical protein [Trypanosoma vivax Y486]